MALDFDSIAQSALEQTLKTGLAVGADFASAKIGSKQKSDPVKVQAAAPAATPAVQKPGTTPATTTASQGGVAPGWGKMAMWGGAIVLGLGVVVGVGYMIFGGKKS